MGLPDPTTVQAADTARPLPIRAVLFDFHQTLVHGGDAATWFAAGWDAAGRRTDATSDLGPDQVATAADFLDRIWEHAAVIDPESTRDEGPERHREVFLRTVERCPGVDPDLAEALYAVMPDQWTAFEDTAPVLAALREAGVRTAIVSNVGFDLRPVIARNGIVVDALVMSYEVGSVKPDRGIFAHALESLGATAQEALMVGDSWRDDAGAAALGIRTLLLPRTDTRVRGLDAVLRLVD